MKYCTHCGGELVDDAVICIHCGCQVENKKPVVKTKDDSMQTVVKVFMVLSCVALGWLIIPLAWCIPMTVHCFTAFKKNEPLGTGFKVCTLLFVSVVAGICLLCMDDEQ